MVEAQTVAITGVSGAVGQALLPYLERDSSVSRVAGFDRRPIPSDVAISKLSFHQLDVRDSQVETWMSGVGTLVHLAFVMFRSRKRKEKEVHSVNIEGTQAVCEAAARQGVRKLVILSSVMAYGLHPDNPIPLTEDMPLRPNRGNFYSQAKALNEGYLDRFAAARPDTVVTRLRACTIVGPHVPRRQIASLTRNPALAARGKEPPYQLLHEEDMARALHLVIQKDAPGPYNVAGDEPLTLRQLVEAHDGRILALPYWLLQGLTEVTWWLGLSPMGAEFADLARYPVVVSTDKLKALGWQPQYTTAEAFAALRADFR